MKRICILLPRLHEPGVKIGGGVKQAQQHKRLRHKQHGGQGDQPARQPGPGHIQANQQQHGHKAEGDQVDKAQIAQQ